MLSQAKAVTQGLAWLRPWPTYVKKPIFMIETNDGPATLLGPIHHLLVIIILDQ